MRRVTIRAKVNGGRYTDLWTISLLVGNDLHHCYLFWMYFPEDSPFLSDLIRHKDASAHFERAQAVTSAGKSDL